MNKKPPTTQAASCEQAPQVQLNLNVRGLSPSATVAINERSDRLRREGRTIFKMGLGQSPFPVPGPVREALRENAFQKDYLAVHGLPQLREAVAAHHRRNSCCLRGSVRMYFSDFIRRHPGSCGRSVRTAGTRASVWTE